MSVDLELECDFTSLVFVFQEFIYYIVFVILFLIAAIVAAVRAPLAPSIGAACVSKTGRLR